jgi:hypothetical protein
MIVIGARTSVNWEDLEDMKGVIIIPKSKKDRQNNGKRKRTKNKQRSTKHCI